MYALYIVLMIFYIIFLILYEISITVAVVKDSKGRRIKNRSIWIVLTVFFPLICPLIYFAKKKTLESSVSKKCMNCATIYDEDTFLCPACKCVEYNLNEIHKDEETIRNSKKWSKVAVISFVIAVISFIAVMAITISSNGSITTGEIGLKEEFPMTHYAYYVDGVETYYDLYGNSYADPNDVLYYDRSGDYYKYDPYNGDYIDSKGNKYPLYCIYFDTDGYLVYYENYYDLEYRNDESLKESDSNGNEYYSHILVSWDADGNLVDSYTGDPLF